LTPNVQITFLGGAGEVGRLAMMMEVAGNRLLFDYGFTASKPPQFPQRAPPLDALFITHCHLDHSGLAPEATRRHMAPMYTTTLTAAISEILWYDSIKIADIEGNPFPFVADDVRTAFRAVEPLEFREEVEMQGVTVRSHSAGHIPGACMYEVEGDQTSLFTGDLNNRATRLVNGARPVPCRNLFIEGTYAGREHPDRHELELEFLDKVDDVIYRGGRVILPAFAVGRTQELELMLEDCGHETWLDGMGKRVTQTYLDHGDYLRSRGSLRASDGQVRYVKSEGQRTRAKEADVIITTSGMLEGGPVGSYLRSLASDPKNAVLLTGYQVEGTNGRALMDGGALEFDGDKIKVDAEVKYFDFSSHAGHSDLVQFIQRCDPETVVVMHSGHPEELANDPALEGYEFILPETGRSFTLAG
jgi:putative mRNA 3-end processing factor